MSFFTGNDTIASADPFITVSAETQAKVSNRVKFDSQIVEFEADPHSSLIALATRANTQDYSHRSKKGLVLIFDKNIKSGTYSVTDQNFPFKNVYYFETGTIPGHATSFEYKSETGTFTVETVESSSEKLHYQINFDFIGVNNNEKLKVEGKSTYIVMMKPQ